MIYYITYNVRLIAQVFQGSRNIGSSTQMSSLSSQIIVDDELMEYEVGRTNSVFKRQKVCADPPPAKPFHVIHDDVPRPRLQNLCLHSAPQAAALPVEPEKEQSAGPFPWETEKCLNMRWHCIHEWFLCFW